MKTLISAEQLLPLVNQPGVRIFDCRFSLQNPTAGLHAYERGHLQGAMFADLNIDLSTPHIPGKTGRHPLPDRARWIDKVLNWGLSPDVQVVLYDDMGGAGAARMWWMLQWIGHDNAMVLDGGLDAWSRAGGQLVRSVPQAYSRTSDHYSQRPSLTRVCTAQEILDEEHLLLDARDAARFRGESETIDPVAGHIPGAQCSPFSSNLQEDGCFRSAEQLREKFSDVANTFLPVVCYCGSGVTACHNILAITHAGLDMPALYAGSWSEWITDPQRPVATGA